MLKTYPTTFLLPKRLKLASLAARRDPDSAAAAATATGQTNASSTLSSTLSSDASLPPQQDHRQPILFHSHQAMSSPAESPPKPKSAIAAAYFPMGYKEAAQQWVGLHVLPSASPPASRAHR
jgi:cardiolipin-specific phospholipase